VGGTVGVFVAGLARVVSSQGVGVVLSGIGGMTEPTLMIPGRPVSHRKAVTARTVASRKRPRTAGA
jgi:hypothetical protein